MQLKNCMDQRQRGSTTRCWTQLSGSRFRRQVTSPTMITCDFHRQQVRGAEGRRSRRELSNEFLVLAKFGFDRAENEPCKVGHIQQCRRAGVAGWGKMQPDRRTMSRMKEPQMSMMKTRPATSTPWRSRTARNHGFIAYCTSDLNRV